MHVPRTEVRARIRDDVRGGTDSRGCTGGGGRRTERLRNGADRGRGGAERRSGEGQQGRDGKTGGGSRAQGRTDESQWISSLLGRRGERDGDGMSTGTPAGGCPKAHRDDGGDRKSVV